MILLASLKKGSLSLCCFSKEESFLYFSAVIIPNCFPYIGYMDRDTRVLSVILYFCTLRSPIVIQSKIYGGGVL